jgi:hypothetical protein
MQNGLNNHGFFIGAGLFHPGPEYIIISLTATAAGITSTGINVIPTGIYDIKAGAIMF